MKNFMIEIENEGFILTVENSRGGVDKHHLVSWSGLNSFARAFANASSAEICEVLKAALKSPLKYATSEK